MRRVQLRNRGAGSDDGKASGGDDRVAEECVESVFERDGDSREGRAGPEARGSHGRAGGGGGVLRDDGSDVRSNQPRRETGHAVRGPGAIGSHPALPPSPLRFHNHEQVVGLSEIKSVLVNQPVS